MSFLVMTPVTEDLRSDEGTRVRACRSGVTCSTLNFDLNRHSGVVRLNAFVGECLRIHERACVGMCGREEEHVRTQMYMCTQTCMQACILRTLTKYLPSIIHGIYLSLPRGGGTRNVRMHVCQHVP